MRRGETLSVVENVHRAFRVAQGPTVFIIKAPSVPYLVLDIHFFMTMNSPNTSMGCQEAAHLALCLRRSAKMFDSSFLLESMIRGWN